MFTEIPLFVRSALLGMGLTALLMGIMAPHIRLSILLALLIASMLIVLGYHAFRRAFGNGRKE